MMNRRHWPRLKLHVNDDCCKVGYLKDQFLIFFFSILINGHQQIKIQRNGNLAEQTFTILTLRIINMLRLNIFALLILSGSANSTAWFPSVPEISLVLKGLNPVPPAYRVLTPNLSEMHSKGLRVRWYGVKWSLFSSLFSEPYKIVS